MAPDAAVIGAELVLYGGCTLSGAAQSGVATSSGAVQGAGAVGTQLASNLSFLDQSSELTNQISLFRQRSADASGRASTYSAVSGLAMQGASLFGGKPSE